MIFIPQGLHKPPIPISVWIRVPLQNRTHSSWLEQKGFLTGNSVAHRTTGEGEQTNLGAALRNDSGGPQGQERRCWVTKQAVGGGMRWRRSRKGLGAGAGESSWGLRDDALRPLKGAVRALLLS